MSKSNCVYPYGKLPPSKELEHLHKTKTLNEIGEIYGCSKTTIKRWFIKYNLPRRRRGLGPKGPNHTIYPQTVPKELLEKFLRENPCNLYIAEKLECSIGKVGNYLKQYNLRIKNYYNHKNFITFRAYRRRVRHLTEQNYATFYDQINPLHHPRTKAGVIGGYQLDHKLSVYYCYRKKIPVDQCASIDNLQMLTWEENCKKWKTVNAK